MKHYIVTFLIILLFASNLYAGQKRVLSPYDLWSGKGASAFEEEKALIETLKSHIKSSKKIFAPSILYIKDKPEIAVLIAAYGGDGEHTEEYSWVFSLKDSKPELIASEIPYFISNIWWVKPGESLGFTGEYILNFCFVCDGPDAASPESIVSIPVSGLLSKTTKKVEISSGKYSRSSIHVRLNELEKKHIKDIKIIRERLQHARNLLTDSQSLF